MVGVPKSTGCFICRKRKIKCDETWPTCVNCQKNGKCCPGPPSKHTFRDLGSRLNANTDVTVVGKASDDQTSKCRRLTQVDERWSESGAVFQKFRISNKASKKSSSGSPPLRSPRSNLRQPASSQHEELSRALVDALTIGSVGHRMSLFGPFIREVPARIGHNAALDAAVACLVNAHSSLVHRKRAAEIANPGLYLRAVQTLQFCLDDSLEGMSTNTLCASVLLGLVEAMAGPRVGNRYLAHVGGAGRLMELQGPQRCQDAFAKEMLRFNRGGIIITAIYQRKQCFLTSPGWREIAFDTTGFSHDDCLYTQILQHMASFPALLRELKDLDYPSWQQIDDMLQSLDMPNDSDDSSSDAFTQFDFTPDNFLAEWTIPEDDCSATHFGPAATDLAATDRMILLEKLKELKHSLCILGEPLNAKLTDGTAALELPSIEDDSPIPTAFHFTNWRVTVAYSCFWSLLILTNKVILKLLPPYDPTIYALEAECRAVSYEICKTWEDAWASKPIGAFHTGLSFILAYEYCSFEVREWILKGLNALLDHQLVDSFRWDEDVIRVMSARLTGDGPDLVFKHSKAAA